MSTPTVTLGGTTLQSSSADTSRSKHIISSLSNLTCMSTLPAAAATRLLDFNNHLPSDLLTFWLQSFCSSFWIYCYYGFGYKACSHHILAEAGNYPVKTSACLAQVLKYRLEYWQPLVKKFLEIIQILWCICIAKYHTLMNTEQPSYIQLRCILLMKYWVKKAIQLITWRISSL